MTVIDARRDKGSQSALRLQTLREQYWFRPVVATAVTIVALLPVITVVLQRWGHPYVPVSDQANIDLRIRDVWTFSANTPLTGVYSRFGWNHPGPIMYYLLALFSGVTGEQAWATLVGNALLQGVAIVWIARLAWKYGGFRWMVPWLTVIALSYVAAKPTVLLAVWNPNITFPFFALFLLQSWLVGLGHARRLIGLAFVATFLVQTHVGYAFLVLVIAGWALVRLWLVEHRAGRSLRRWEVWRAPLIVIVVLWFVPVVVDTALHFPGNLVRIVQFYVGLSPGPKPAAVGLRAALGYLATEFRWRPPWLGGPDLTSIFDDGLSSQSSVAWLLLPILLIGSSWGLARWRDRKELQIMVELLAVSLLAGALTLAAVRGEPYPYLFYWRIIIAAASVVLSCFVLVETLDVRHVARNVLCLILVAGMTIASISLSRRVAAASGPLTPMEPVAASILEQLQATGQPTGKVLIRNGGSLSLDSAIVDQLAREGAPVFVDPGSGYIVGDARTATPSQVHEVWYVTEGSLAYSLITQEVGAKVLAMSHPLPKGELAELVNLQRTLSHRLREEGKSDDLGDLSGPFVWFQLHDDSGIPSAELLRLGQLNIAVVQHTCLCAVISFPSDRFPPTIP
jgi:hypothetical protein